MQLATALRISAQSRALPGLALVVLGLVWVLLGPAPALGEPGSSPALGRVPVGVWPLVPEPEVVRGFEPPSSEWGPGHRGVDLLGRAGQPVRAALPGRVSFAGVLAGRGVVVVDHGGTRTTYEPVDASVAVGTAVGAGGTLGRLQPAGSHCFPRVCLHWGWIEASTYLDPLLLVGAGPVRLLPLWRDTPVTVTPRPWTPPPLPYAGWRPVLALF